MISPLDQARLEGARAVLRTCLSERTFQLDPAMWSWTYDHNPVRPGQPRVFVFADEDEVFGLLGTLPVRLWTGARTLDASWGIDIFVLPEFHNAGIGGMLIERWDAATDVSLSLGVTDMAFEVFQSSGRVFVGDVPLHKRLLAPHKVLEKRLKSGLAARVAGKALEWKTAAGLAKVPEKNARGALSFEPLRSFDAGFDALWLRAREGLGCAVERSAAWLAWRFERYPRPGIEAWRVRAGGELEGYVVTALRERDGLRVGYLADVLVADRGAALDFALARAVEALRERGADVVECLASHADYARGLARAGFLARPTKTRLLYRVNAATCESDLADARDLGRWHVTLADSDDLTVLLNED